MGYNTPCCCDDGDCPGQTRRRCVENRWAYSSAGRAKGSVFCHIYNFILLYSSVPLLELLIWARSSVWESQRNITRARLEQQTAQTNQAKIYKITKYGPVAQLGAHHIRIVGVVGSNPIRSTRKSREIISFTAFLQLFCKNGGPAAQPFLPYFPYKPPLRSHPLFRTPETIIIFVLRPSGKAEKIWK